MMNCCYRIARIDRENLRRNIPSLIPNEDVSTSIHHVFHSSPFLSHLKNLSNAPKLSNSSSRMKRNHPVALRGSTSSNQYQESFDDEEELILFDEEAENSEQTDSCPQPQIPVVNRSPNRSLSPSTSSPIIIPSSTSKSRSDVKTAKIVKSLLNITKVSQPLTNIPISAPDQWDTAKQTSSGEEFELDFELSDDDQDASKRNARLKLIKDRERELLQQQEQKLKNTQIIETNATELSLDRIPAISRKTLLHGTTQPRTTGRGGTAASRRQLIQTKLQEFERGELDDRDTLQQEASHEKKNQHDQEKRARKSPAPSFDPMTDPLLAGIKTTVNSTISTGTTPQLIQMINQQQIQQQKLENDLQFMTLLKSLLRQARQNQKAQNVTDNTATSTSTYEPDPTTASLQVQLANLSATTLTIPSGPTTTASKPLTAQEKKQQTLDRRLRERKTALLEWRILVRHIRNEMKIIEDLVIQHHIKPNIIEQSSTSATLSSTSNAISSPLARDDSSEDEDLFEDETALIDDNDLGDDQYSQESPHHDQVNELHTNMNKIQATTKTFDTTLVSLSSCPSSVPTEENPHEQSFVPRSKFNKQFRGANNTVYYTANEYDDDVLL